MRPRVAIFFRFSSDAPHPTLKLGCGGVASRNSDVQKLMLSFDQGWGASWSWMGLLPLNGQQDAFCQLGTHTLLLATMSRHENKNTPLAFYATLQRIEGPVTLGPVKHTALQAGQSKCHTQAQYNTCCIAYLRSCTYIYTVPFKTQTLWQPPMANRRAIDGR